MRCPYCKKDDDKVVDSRSSEDGFTIRRRRECIECGRRYTTYERIEDALIRVVKKDGTREDFDRRKLLGGLRKACEKRPVSTEMLDRIADEIESELYRMFEKEVPSRFLGQSVMDRLKTLDQVAYVRFASVYREFKDIREFMEELRPMLDKS